MTAGREHRRTMKMKKLLGFLALIVLIVNLFGIVYLIKDIQELHMQVSDVNNIRVQLPLEFKDALLEQTLATTKTMANIAIAHASTSVSNVLSNIAKGNHDTMAALTNGFNAAVTELNINTKSVRDSVNKICQRQDQELLERIKDAETAFSLYQRNPTNDTAVLYLQIAIRKNPSQLKYLKELRRIVNESGLETGLVQEYRTMLSYCLDEIADDGGLEEVVAMVRDLRSSVDRVVAEEYSAEESKREQSVKDLKEELSKGVLVVAFDTAAREVAKRRMEICKELMALEGHENYREEYAYAEMIATVATTADRIEVYLNNAKGEISRINKMKNQQESELHEALIALEEPSVSQPIIEARQAVQSLCQFDMNSFPTNIAEGCMEKIRCLEKKVQTSLALKDRIRADKIISYVEEMNDESTWINTGYGQKTGHLRQLDEQFKVIAKYIGTIVDTEIANEVLDKQSAILEKSKEIQRQRLKEYQKKASAELKAIAKEIRAYKAAAWRQVYKKNQAVPLLERLVKIDSTLLVPEVNELYQYEYDLLMADFNAWVEEERAYKEKAEFMIKLEGIEKEKLESL